MSTGHKDECTLAGRKAGLLSDALQDSYNEIRRRRSYIVVSTKKKKRLLESGLVSLFESFISRGLLMAGGYCRQSKLFFLKVFMFCNVE